MLKTEIHFTFNKTYFSLAIAFLSIEIYIGMYVKDNFIRPYLGDFLVVILIYCLLKSFWKETPLKVALYVLLFSFIVEVLQYFKIVEVLGLQDIKLAGIIIGTNFAWEDLVAYVLGTGMVLVVEYFKNKERLNAFIN